MAVSWHTTSKRASECCERVSAVWCVPKFPTADIIHAIIISSILTTEDIILSFGQLYSLVGLLDCEEDIVGMVGWEAACQDNP